jgi:hypothetical protein
MARIQSTLPDNAATIMDEKLAAGWARASPSYWWRDGLSGSARAGGKLWSLPAHAPMMVRVLLAEQLGRAMTVIQNHPYHRE